MPTTTIAGLLGQFGVVPVVLLLIAVVWFLLREIKKEVTGLTGAMKNIGVEMTALRDDLLQKVKELKEHSDKQDEKIAETLEAIEERIACIEREYQTKEDHYKDMGGWREELREMRRLLDKILLEKLETAV